MIHRLRTLARELAFLLLFLALTIVMTWPLARHADNATSDFADPYINSWIVSWVARTLPVAPSAVFDAPMFYPASNALALSENLLGVAIFAIPLRAAGLPPLLIYNILFIAGFATSGYGAFVLARKVTHSTAASVAAGIFFAFCLFRFNHIAHLQHVWSASVPLLLAALFHFFERTSWRAAALLVAAFVWNAYANMHWLVFASVAIAATFVFLAALRGRLLDRELWVRTAAVALVGGALVLPLEQPYEDARERYGLTRSVSEIRQYSAEPGDWLVAPVRSGVYGRLFNDGSRDPERSLFSGFLVLILTIVAVTTVRAPAPQIAARAPAVPRGVIVALDVAIVVTAIAWAFSTGAVRKLPFIPEASVAGVVALGLIAVRLWVRWPGSSSDAGLADFLRRSRVPISLWVALLWIALGYLGSLGVNGWFHSMLVEWSDAVAGIRAPARWAIVAYTGATIAIAHAVVAIAGRLHTFFDPAGGASATMRRALEVATGLVISLLFLYELHAAPIRWYLHPTAEPPVYAWLAQAKLQGAVLELPIEHAASEYRYLYHAASHEKRLVNGVSGFTPPAHVALIAEAHADPIAPQFLERLRRIGCEVVVIHVDHLGPHEERVRRWLLDGLATGALQPVGWFPHQLRGDYVVSVGRPAETLVPTAARRDFAAAIAAVETKFPLRPERPYALLHVPSVWRGSMRIDGWAAAEAGVREVNLLFENGAVRFPAKLERRDDLRVAYPDLSHPQLTGFVAEFPKRPAAVRRETDLQVEIVDTRGERSRFEAMFVTWRPRGDIRGIEWDAEPLARLSRSLSLDPQRDARRLVRGELTPQRLGETSHLFDRRLTDRAFVDGIFRAIVARAPDEGTRAMYLDDLRRGKERERVMRTLFRSREFELKHLTEAAEAEAWLQ